MRTPRMLTPRDVPREELVTPAEHGVPSNRQEVGFNSHEQGIAIADKADDTLTVLDQLANPDSLTAEVIAVGD